MRFSRLHLVEEVGAAVVLQPAGEDLAARLRHQQGVLKLSRAPAVPRHRRPAVRPRLVLPATWKHTHTGLVDITIYIIWTICEVLWSASL